MECDLSIDRIYICLLHNYVRQILMQFEYYCKRRFKFTVVSILKLIKEKKPL